MLVLCFRWLMVELFLRRKCSRQLNSARRSVEGRLDSLLTKDMCFMTKEWTRIYEMLCDKKDV